MERVAIYSKNKKGEVIDVLGLFDLTNMVIVCPKTSKSGKLYVDAIKVDSYIPYNNGYIVVANYETKEGYRYSVSYNLYILKDKKEKEVQ